MTNKRIQEIKALCEAATPGRWEIFRGWGMYLINNDKGQKDIVTLQNAKRADAEFIAAARQIIPELLEELGKEREIRKRVMFNLECVLKENK